jgi:hypothetical protein
MTKDRSRKKAIRKRMAETGQRYTYAARHLDLKGTSVGRRYPPAHLLLAKYGSDVGDEAEQAVPDFVHAAQRARAEAHWPPQPSTNPCPCTAPCRHGQEYRPHDENCTGRSIHLDRYPAAVDPPIDFGDDLDLLPDPFPAVIDVTEWDDEYQCDTCHYHWAEPIQLEEVPWGQETESGIEPFPDIRHPDLPGIAIIDVRHGDGPPDGQPLRHLLRGTAKILDWLNPRDTTTMLRAAWRGFCVAGATGQVLAHCANEDYRVVWENAQPVLGSALAHLGQAPSFGDTPGTEVNPAGCARDVICDDAAARTQRDLLILTMAINAAMPEAARQAEAAVDRESCGAAIVLSAELADCYLGRLRTYLNAERKWFGGGSFVLRRDKQTSFDPDVPWNH